jgi:hypothetical protein
MAKDNHPIDDLFRGALQDHTVTPSEKARKAFLEEASGISTVRRPGLKWLYLGIALLAVITAGTLLVTTGKHPSGSASKPTISGRTPEKTTVGNTVPTNVTAPVSHPQGTSSSATASTHENPATSPAAPSARPARKTAPAGSAGTVKAIRQPAAAVSTPATISAPVSRVSANTHPTNKDREQLLALAPITVTGPFAPEWSISPVPVVSTSPAKPAASQVSEPSGRKSMPAGWTFGTGLSYSPEWLFNTLEGTKYVNNVAIDQVFRFDRYSVRTGAGLSITTGTNQVLVSYNQYLGTFQKLDSITFHWNQAHTQMVPTYYLSKKDVFDSLIKQESAKIVKRYTYLQIPLILGYDFWTSDRFSLGVRLGPVFSVLVSTQQLSGSYDPGKNKIITVNQATPDRINTNWQILGGVCASYNLSGSIGLELEPEFRYYFNSVYEKSDVTKKPWSVGFRASFLVKYW